MQLVQKHIDMLGRLSLHALNFVMHNHKIMLSKLHLVDPEVGILIKPISIGMPIPSSSIGPKNTGTKWESSLLGQLWILHIQGAHRILLKANLLVFL